MHKISKKIMLFSIALICTFLFIENSNAKSTDMIKELRIWQKFSDGIGDNLIFGSSTTMEETYKTLGYYLGNQCTKGCLKYNYSNNLAGSFDEIQIVKMDTTSVEKREEIANKCMEEIFRQEKYQSNLENNEYPPLYYALYGQLSLLVTKGDNTEFSGVDIEKEIVDKDLPIVSFKSLYPDNSTEYCKVVDTYVKEYANGSYEKAEEYLNGNAGAGSIQNYNDFFLSCISERARQNFIANKVSTFSSDSSYCNAYKNGSSQTQNNHLLEIGGRDVYAQSINYINDLADAFKGLYANDDKQNQNVNNDINYACVGQDSTKRLIMSTAIPEQTIKNSVGEISKSNSFSIKTYCSNMLGLSSNQVALYKIKYSIGKTYNTADYRAVSYTCSWKFNTGESGTINQSFTNNISFDSGKMYISNVSNIKTLNGSIFFTQDDLTKINIKDSGFLSGIANNIQAKGTETKKEVTATTVAIGVAAIGLKIAADAALTAATGGTYLVAKAISTAVVGGLVLGGIVGLEQVVVPIAEGTMGQFGTYQGYVDVNYGNGVSADQSGMSDISCLANEKVKEASIEHDFEVTCDNLMTGDFGKIIDYIMNIMRFVAIALLIVFGAFDFIRPIVSGDTEQLNKSGGKFVKRLIIAVLVFFVPALVELLLSLIGRTC